MTTISSINMSNSKTSFDIAFQKLRKEEERFDAFIAQLKAKRAAAARSPDLSELVRAACDNLKESLLEAIQLNSGDGQISNTSGTDVTLPCSSDKNYTNNVSELLQNGTLVTLLDPNWNNKNHESEKPAPPTFRRPTPLPLVALEPQDRDEELETLTLNEDDKQETATASKAKADVVPSQQTIQAWGQLDDGLRHEVVATLQRMTGRVQGFLDWLKDKVKAAACKAWEGVRKAFSSVLTFLTGLCSSIASACRGGAGYSKMHTA